LIRRPLVLLFSILLFVALVGLLAYRPATVTGVDAGELASSVEGTLGGAHPRARCQQLHGSTWRCRVRAERGASAYRIRIQSFGCWKARLAGAGPRLPRRPSGCIGVLDYL
jgi:hypothetical protein